MNEAIYEDGTITVTPTEIRAKGFVLYVENVSSISVSTVRPTKWLGLLMTFPIVLMIGVILLTNRLFAPLLDQYAFGISVLPFLWVVPICVLTVLAFFYRITRLFLQTTGGPVLLASKISFTDSYGTEMQYKEIKDAIEKAVSLRKKQATA